MFGRPFGGSKQCGSRSGQLVDHFGGACDVRGPSPTRHIHFRNGRLSRA
jgi:hypothetical protein